ncbi:twin-arginine translocase TatA/TatE family subunit [Sporomusa acidovorans]|uniref:Sec-independent protein translocase protein TatA n=1 Tax=Sporomusa acidovorans (strain ATCC 49682 / DSM 3132 / Mol) TaxID=1123286 RepID=A0ABZ3J751_SPOA4|nr:twin-arginine translocase TatA/TatE family subunit [Sporomusa acidovorans]OZC24205.1 Sec-independent protein translocase protein TatAd [Sporomusa acidovorans DSM 3132]SDF77162.1 sec-independent protein translocase protein TatA [Sporomusa acidovorans]
MFNFSMPELTLILVIALVVFGPGKLPEVGKALGKGIEEFKRATAGEPNKDILVKVEHEEAKRVTTGEVIKDQSVKVEQTSVDKK